MLQNAGILNVRGGGAEILGRSKGGISASYSYLHPARQKQPASELRLPSELDTADLRKEGTKCRKLEMQISQELESAGLFQHSLGRQKHECSSCKKIWHCRI